MSTHFFYPEPLPQHGVGTQVWWSLNPTGHALIFVHGFRGTALGTWSKFPSMLKKIPKLAGWDLFFFGYDGQHTEMVSSASDVETLLDALDASPREVFRKSGGWESSRRVHPESYRRIVISAHSLGTVVSRRALLNGYQRRPEAAWAKKTELVLYAPAHNGAKLFALISETFGFLMPGLSIAQLFGKFIVLRDLKIGSPALVSLKDELRSLYDSTKTPTLRASEVVWARNDSVVSNAVLFPDDPTAPASNLQGFKHSTVCKPDIGSTLPLDILVGRL